MNSTKYPPRRREFITSEGQQSLQEIRVGVLATLDPSGECEARPLNFVWLDGALYFHTAPQSNLAARTRATFTGWHDEAWIPSYWRHAEQACPATTYYNSVVARGALTRVECLETKARVLQAFMHKYQPEGGYQPLQADLKLYAGPLAALCVLRLDLEDLSCKAKYGQHLQPAAREKVLQGLIGRADVRTTELMRRYNELARPDGFSADGGAFAVQEIWDLLKHTYWAWKRNEQMVERNRRQALAQVGYLGSGRLMAYARIEGFWLFDVVVHPELRGQGIGKQLIELLLEQPKVQALPRLGLDTRDAQDFYARYGFQLVGKGPSGSWIMIRPGAEVASA